MSSLRVNKPEKASGSVKGIEKGTKFMVNAKAETQEVRMTHRKHLNEDVACLQLL